MHVDPGTKFPSPLLPFFEVEPVRGGAVFRGGVGGRRGALRGETGRGGFARQRIYQKAADRKVWR